MKDLQMMHFKLMASFLASCIGLGDVDYICIAESLCLSGAQKRDLKKRYWR